ncbi:MAG: hypothetical protein HKN47_14365 [Pirellulaceae bacterium]|nr:hypothetical protein [Pirellulaceae bacterium]
MQPKKTFSTFPSMEANGATIVLHLQVSAKRFVPLLRSQFTCVCTPIRSYHPENFESEFAMPNESDPIHHHGRSLEDEFFFQVDQRLREKLRETMHDEESRTALMQATGIHDNVVLQHLVEAGLEASTIAALGLAPVVFVAWADGSVSRQERQTVMGEALRRGLATAPAAFHLVESWLMQKPSEKLWTSWVEYVEKILENADDTVAEGLKESVMLQSTEVARASSGLLGLHRIGAEEQKVLDKIKAAFDPK